MVASGPGVRSSARPFGQAAVGVVLLANAVVCLVCFVMIYLGEWVGVVELRYPVALLFSLSLPLALTSVASPILVCRRSALGLILAWCVPPGLLVDGVLSIFSALDWVPLLLKAPVDVALLVVLAVFLLRRVTYEDLRVTSYGFPVITRVLGSTPGRGGSAISQGTGVSEPSTISPDTHHPSVARNIKEAYMRAYIRSADTLRMIALVVRIISIVLLTLSAVGLLLELAIAVEEFGRRSSPMMHPGEKWLPFLGLALLGLVPIVLSGVLFATSYLLTGVSELLHCQASRGIGRPAAAQV